MYENKHNIQKPHFFDIDETFDVYISNLNTKIRKYPVVFEFKSVFDENFTH